jgi:ABC-2 type transport system ATP-binding protein
MPTRLLFDGIRKRFGQRAALESLSLSVEAGEIYGFLGPNGAGKSTAIHLAMGFLHASGGRGELLGMPFVHARAARARVGYVPDAPVFFSGSALDAVLLAARLNSTETLPNETSLKARAKTLLGWMELPAEGLNARKFSRGMQQRLALVQAMVTQPDLLILDEPTSALDPPAVLLIREALEQARARGTAVFFSSHQLREVEQLCDRAAFLDEGRLLHAGPMAELLEEGATARVTLRGVFVDERFTREHGAERLPHADGGRGDRVYRIAVARQRSFLESAWAAGAELVRVEREQRSLEDLFAARRASRKETSR